MLQPAPAPPVQAASHGNSTNINLASVLNEGQRQSSASAPTALRVIYFFAGLQRKGDIREWLESACRDLQLELKLEEVDLLRGAEHDLLNDAAQKAHIQNLGSYDFVLITPPCASHSRATWANSHGPHPVRSKEFPLGFPWLSLHDRKRADMFNSLVKFTWEILFTVNKLCKIQNIIAFTEHPEDLGKVFKGRCSGTPASIWQSEECDSLLQAGWWCGAYKQRDFGAPTDKPSRSMANSMAFKGMAPHAMPVFNNDGSYAGPVEKSLVRQTVSLMRTSSDTGPFRTAAAAAYPSEMCKLIVACLFKARASWKPLETPSGGDFLASGGLSGGAGLALNADLKKDLLSRMTSLKIAHLESAVKGPAHKKPTEFLDPSSVVAADHAPSGLEREGISGKASSNKWDLVEGTDYVKSEWWGTGDPIAVQKIAGKFGRPMQDGGGLCSPGRWVQAHRNFPPQSDYFTQTMDSWLEEKADGRGEKFLESIVYDVIAGKLDRSPFEGQLGKLKFRWGSLLAEKGHIRPLGKRRSGQQIDFGFAYLMASYLRDPDASAMIEFCQGVRVGVGVQLPRTPAVWPPKSRWPLGEFGEDPVSPLNDNYPSAKILKEALEAELADQRARGWIVDFKLKDAQNRFGQISVAPLAIIEERGGKFRTLLDATNRVQINHRIKVLDSEQCPTALDVQAAISADTEVVLPVVALVVDVEKAHQQVPVHELDWGHVACSASDMPTDPKLREDWIVSLKTVGTYGVSSASWQWSRFASLFQRLAYYCCRLAYIFRFADDFMALSGNYKGTRFTRPILRFIMLCDILDVPLKWPKTRGGIRCDFVGYYFAWDRMTGGLSDARAAWLVNWARSTASDGIVVARALKAALGRFSFSAALLRFVLPFLGPFYAWVSAIEDGAAWALPAALIILLRWVADKIEQNTFVTLRHEPPVRMNRFFKADAKAEGGEVCVGGFEVCGAAELKECRWFSYKLDPSNAPWAFVKHGEAYRAIASLELYATILCVILFCDTEGDQQQGYLTMTGISDNRGNEALVVKNMTSKFPLYLVLIELTEQLIKRRITLDLKWQAREYNEAADALSNSDFSLFCMDLRLNRNLDDLDWLVLPKLMQDSIDLHNIISKRKSERVVTVTPKATRKRKAPGLRVTDPW